MAGYVGYQGYDPARAQVDRKRQIAELLQQGATDTSPKSFWEGAAQLGKAFIARGANERADAAESAYATDKARRLAQYFNPNADEQGRNMAPDVNVSADVEPALPTTDAHIKALASTFAGSVAPQGGSAPLPAGGQMAPAPASTPTTNVKAIAAALTPVETGMPGPGQISMSEPVSMPMTAAQMPKAGPDEVALFQQAMRITGGDLMQARALVESRMAPVRDAEARAYRDKTDARRDFVDDRTHNAGREDAGIRNAQWQDNFNQGVDEFGKTFGETVRHNRVGEANDAAVLAAKKAEAEAKANGQAVFEGPQLATIYKDNIGALDKAREDQTRLDTISSNAQQFVSTAKDYPAESDGVLADVWQFFDPRTGSLKQNTSTIAPLMRQPGSGSSSDKDVAMYQAAGVSINNTKDGNNRFALASQHMSERNKQYTDFLNAAITPQDPQSRQKAEQIWNAYKESVRLFDDKTGAPISQVMPFRDWYQQTQGGQAQAPAQYTTDEVTQAKLALQNWDRLPASVKTPQNRVRAEQVAGVSKPVSQQAAPASAEAPPVRVNSPQERDALPPGTKYVAPDGSVKIKR